MKEFVVPSDSLSSSHQTTPFTQVEFREIESPSVDLPLYSTTSHIQNLNTSLHCEFDFFGDVLSPRPPSVGSCGQKGGSKIKA